MKRCATVCDANVQNQKQQTDYKAKNESGTKDVQQQIVVDDRVLKHGKPTKAIYWTNVGGIRVTIALVVMVDIQNSNRIG